MESEQLEELVPRCRNGDREAFRVLYEELSPEIFTFVAGRISQRDTALDTVHDVFIDLWKGLQSFEYRTVSGFYRYVFTIVRRRLAKVYARTAKETSLPENYDIEDTAPLPDKLEHVAIEKALEKMNDLDRTIIELRYWSGLSVKEVADRIGISESNVKVRHHRVIRALQETIGQYE